MKIDKLVDDCDYSTLPGLSQQLEAAGYDGLLLGERHYDPFLPLVLAAEHSRRLQLATAVAIALPRSPTHVAYLANDLQTLSEGRFLLGLGSQVKAHIERRFSAEWAQPVARMREFVLAVRALFDSWQRQGRVDFQGDHYSITLMTPYFSPAPNPYGWPPIWLAAVGPRMCEMAGEVADGVFVHPFTSGQFLEQQTLHHVRQGAQRRARPDQLPQLAMPALIAVGATPEALAHAEAAVRRQIAFYASTSAYRPVLAMHGWEELQGELNTLARGSRWDEMPALISDEILDTFAVRGSPTEVGKGVADRFGSLLSRVSLYTPNYEPGAEVFAEVIETMRARA